MPVLLCAAVRAFSCDESACKSPDCMCPSIKPPGSLSPKDIPQFVLISVRVESLAAVSHCWWTLGPVGSAWLATASTHQ